MGNRTSVDSANVDELIAWAHAEASAATGLSNFGSNDYQTGLRRLVQGFVDASRGVEGGAADLTGQLVVSLLIARLRTEEGWRLHPEVLQNDIVDPVFIIGIPRTGTTALFGLLSADTRFQVPERWLHQYPQPRPPRSSWPQRADYQEVVAQVESAPDIIKRGHMVLADEGDECLQPMAQTFVSNMFGSQAAIPDYDQWMLRQDMTPSFRRYADFLRLLGGSSPDQPWLLKNPSHTFSLPELFAVFPNACIIHTHRRLQEALGSLVSLLNGISAAMGHEKPPLEIARREIPLYAEAMRRTMKDRQGHEDAIFNVDYRRFVADPIDVARRIYDKFGIEFTPEVEEAMQRWVDAHPQNARGRHEYDPEALGVDMDTLEAHYAAYMDEFDLR